MTDPMKTAKITATIFLSFLFMTTALGQNNMVSDAIQAYHAGNYQSAYELSGDALANIDALSDDFAAAAFYYLAKSRIQILRGAMESGDKEKLSSMQNSLIESYYDYKEALKRADNQLKEDIEADLMDLYNPILQTGLSALNTSGDERQPASVREAALQAATGYLTAARDISATYLASDLLGQAYLASGDSLKALSLFSGSIEAYSDRPPASPDFLMAYVYFRKAMIERYLLHNNSLALATLREGAALLADESSRAAAAGAMNATEKKAYLNGLTDLTGFELDIYLHDKSLRDEAVARFREVIMLYPEDYEIHVAYANLLENIDPLLAIDAYETAISIDDSKELAFFNIAAVYNNLGSAYYTKGLNHADDAIADSLYNEANRCFRNAYTYMEEAYRLNPGALETIQALIQIALTLGLDEQVEFYKQKERELRGF